MADSTPIRLNSIADYHRLMGLPRPAHPLISLIDVSSVQLPEHDLSMVFDFYSVALKRTSDKMKYGQQYYDFDSGVLFFVAPDQRVTIIGGAALQHSGWILLVHPDLLWGTPLAKTIRRYEFFGYSVHEALHLSEREEAALVGLLREIEREYENNLDAFTHPVIAAQLELLFTYAERFYHRQFLTRKAGSHQLLTAMEELLDAHFRDEEASAKGLPTVQSIADRLHVSPNYLSSVVRLHTGLNTQQHIQHRLIERAKERLSTSQSSISEIAYELGFGHPQSFSKLFKAKTAQSPLEFRQSFN